ncbi:visual pigment-like receptor peropsin [Pomacea canaliculata]|uniref:visual pigment-like receptor peropsin n=1 Tax=Pomacea canaliculata TaxID=400727 RepID=UPI000D739816|nr:visual pigment-like receptor peropsin [Pomacea canaliculata]
MQSDNNTTDVVQEMEVENVTTWALMEEDDWQVLVRRYDIRPLSSAGYMGCAIYLVIIGLVATTGNTTTLVMFLRNRKLRVKPHNILILNLAISDIGISVFGYPLTTSSCFAERYLWGMVGCKIQGFTTFFLAMADMYTLTVISVYRWVAICRPHYNHRLNFSFTVKVVVGVWVAAFITTAPPLVGMSTYIFEPFGTSCTIDWDDPAPVSVFYIYALVLVAYIIPVVVMVYCYWKVVARSKSLLKKVKQSKCKTLSLGEAEEANSTMAECKVTWISLLMVSVFVVIWSPYTFVCVWAIYDPDIPMWLNTLPTMCAKSSCMLNPVIFYLTNPLFRATFRATFSRRRKILPFLSRTKSRTFKVDRTKDGIYIGESRVTLRQADTTLF